MSGSHVPSGSSGSDFSSDPLHANVDEKKRKRMISNRESARRSRMKKQKQLEDLVNEVSNIEDQNARLRQSIDLAASRFGEIDSANNVLRSQVAELTDRLRSLNTVLEIVKEVSGFDLEIPEVPDLLLKPWQLPCPVQPIAASSSAIADVSQY